MTTDEITQLAKEAYADAGAQAIAEHLQAHPEADPEKCKTLPWEMLGEQWQAAWVDKVRAALAEAGRA